jgi:hypothetical protein
MEGIAPTLFDHDPQLRKPLATVRLRVSSVKSLVAIDRPIRIVSAVTRLNGL